MTVKRVWTLAAAVFLVAILAACGVGDSENGGAFSDSSAASIGSPGIRASESIDIAKPESDAENLDAIHEDEVHEHSFENNYVVDDNDEIVEVNAEDIYDAENKIFSFPECSWNEDFKALETHFGVEKMPFYPEKDPQLWVELVVNESFSLRLIPFFQDMSVYSGAVQKQFELLAEDTLVDVNTEHAGKALVELYTELCGEPEMSTTDYSAMGSPLVDTGYRWSLISTDGKKTGMDIIFVRNGEELESLDILVYVLAD